MNVMRNLSNNAAQRTNAVKTIVSPPLTDQVQVLMSQAVDLECQDDQEPLYSAIRQDMPGE